jgi:hypothetical protein
MTALNRDPARSRYAGTLIDEGKYDEAEAFLADPIKDGDIVAKLLIVDARLRSGKRGEARDLFLTIGDQVPAQLRYPYGAAAALVAMFLRDDKIRRTAIAALSGLPTAAVESDKNIRNYLKMLRETRWGDPS